MLAWRDDRLSPCLIERANQSTHLEIVVDHHHRRRRLQHRHRPRFRSNHFVTLRRLLYQMGRKEAQAKARELGPSGR